jgi:hypothetical protein
MNNKSKKNSFLNTAGICIFIIVLVCFIYSCNVKKDNTGTGETADQEITIEAKRWTFMFYNDADFFNAYDPLYDFKAKACSNENLNVFVLQDTNTGGARILYIDAEHQIHTLKWLGEVNMADPATLSDFISFVKGKSPTGRYILSFYDHGASWEGACVDMSAEDDWLSMDQMQQALTDTGGVDLVCFSAPCNMGSLESVYELRNWTHVYIGSEDTSGYIWWRDTMKDICDILEANPDISNIQLGREIVESIQTHSVNYPEYLPGLTMSAVRTDKMGDVIATVDALALAFLDRMEEASSLIPLVYDTVTAFGLPYSRRDIDVYDFAEKSYNAAPDGVIRSRLADVMDAVSDAVIAECHGSDNENAHGLSIHFPTMNNYNSFYGYPGLALDFPADSHWNEFLEAYCNSSGVTGIRHEVKPVFIETDGFTPPPRPKK